VKLDIYEMTDGQPKLACSVYDDGRYAGDPQWARLVAGKRRGRSLADMAVALTNGYVVARVSGMPRGVAVEATGQHDRHGRR